MFKEIDSNKAKRKTEIKELAEKATEKINENKILLETLSLYYLQIKNIKKILDKKEKLINNNNNNNNLQSQNLPTNSTTNETKENNNEQNINIAIKNNFLLYYKELKNSVENLKETKKKLLQKYEINNNIIFDESSLTKLDLNKNRIDIFILYYELKQKNDIIRKLNENVINSKRHSIFREMRRESELNRNSATNYLNNDNIYLQRDLQIECRNYNKCINRCKKKKRNLEKFKDTKKYFGDIIKYFNNEKKKNTNNNNKINNNKIFNKKIDAKTSNIFSRKKNNNNNNQNAFNSITLDELGKNHFGSDSLDINQGDDDYNNKDQTYLPNSGQINDYFFSSGDLKISGKIDEKEKERKKNMKQKFNFLTVDELFDLDNEEGEKEVIIQEELHSDDEVIFEKKIKNKNRVNTKYLSDIKKVVPRLYLNQIEFNKKKVMNEADLYSFQRREYNKQNIDENIKTMKKKIKIMKKRISINEEKSNALLNFIQKAKAQYTDLKPIKVLSSMKDYDISFMKKEFYNFRTKKEDKENTIAEVDEKNYTIQDNNKADFGDDEDDKYNDDDDIDDYSDEMRKRKGKIKKDDKGNNILMTEADDNDNKKNKNEKKFLEYDDENKAKSK